jgi:hypothetical protein
MQQSSDKHGPHGCMLTRTEFLHDRYITRFKRQYGRFQEVKNSNEEQYIVHRQNNPKSNLQIGRTDAK